MSISNIQTHFGNLLLMFWLFHLYEFSPKPYNLLCEKALKFQGAIALLFLSYVDGATKLS